MMTDEPYYAGPGPLKADIGAGETKRTLLASPNPQAVSALMDDASQSIIQAGRSSGVCITSICWRSRSTCCCQ